MLKCLIIGSGPAGCYIVEQLLKNYNDIFIDIVDSLPHPFGLLRTGVAPDHTKIKALYNYFENILTHPSVRFYGNVTIGKDIEFTEIITSYHAHFICTGSSNDNIIDESLSTKIYSGSKEVVQWYNGYSHLNKQFNPNNIGKNVSIIGMGNVALDIARIFLKPLDQLSKTEISTDCIDILQKVNVDEVNIFARRGPTQAKCTAKELEELLDLTTISVNINSSDLYLSKKDIVEHELSGSVEKKYNLFKRIVNTHTQSPKQKKLNLFFYSKYTSFEESLLTFEKTTLIGEAQEQKAQGTGTYYSIESDYLISCIGYKSQKIEPIVFDSIKHIFPNDHGKIADSLHPNIYVCGWSKRGPSGVIGTNKRDAKETIETFKKHYSDIPIEKEDLCSILLDKKISFFTLDDWKKLDKYEQETGQNLSKDRLKITKVENIKKILNKLNVKP